MSSRELPRTMPRKRAEIRLRAERRLGELTRAMAAKAGANGSDTRCPHGMAGMNPAGLRIESDHPRSDHRASSAQVTEAA